MKKVTLTLGQVMDLDAELNGIKNQQTGEPVTVGILNLELDLILKYHLEKLLKQTAEQKTLVEKLREELIKKHGTQDGENWGKIKADKVTGDVFFKNEYTMEDKEDTNFYVEAKHISKVEYPLLYPTPPFSICRRPTFIN